MSKAGAFTTMSKRSRGPKERASSSLQKERLNWEGDDAHLSERILHVSKSERDGKTT